MDRDQVLAILRAHEPELRAAGVEHLRLFGSVARGEQDPESDIDIALDFHPTAKVGFSLGRLQLDLSDWLATNVDVVLPRSLHPALRDRILGEAIDAF